MQTIGMGLSCKFWMMVGIVAGLLWLVIIYGLYFGVPFIWNLIFGTILSG